MLESSDPTGAHPIKCSFQCISPDGSLVAAVAGSGHTWHVHVLDINSGTFTRGHAVSHGTSVAFLPDSTGIVQISGWSSTNLVVYQPHSGDQLAELRPMSTRPPVRPQLDAP